MMRLLFEDPLPAAAVRREIEFARAADTCRVRYCRDICWWCGKPLIRMVRNHLRARECHAQEIDLWTKPYRMPHAIRNLGFDALAFALVNII